MTAAELAALAVLCISPAFDDEPTRTTTLYKRPALCIEALAPAAAIAPVLPHRAAVRKAKRADRCGSMTAVWYVRKDGRKKYRCR